VARRELVGDLDDPRQPPPYEYLEEDLESLRMEMDAVHDPASDREVAPERIRDRPRARKGEPRERPR
jgi:hypothetical protein